MKHNQTLGFTTFSSHERGFTLIELLVVIAVLGILAGGILIALNIGGTLDKANITSAKKFAASLENGLVISQVGKWSFEESAPPFKDTSGYGNNGSWNGGVAQESASNCTLGFGACAKFDNQPTTFVDIPYKASLLPPSITITAWANTNTLPSWAGIVTNKVNSTDGINLQIGSTENIAALIGDGSTFVYVRTDWVPKTGVWYHIAITHDATTNENKLYVNGKLEKTLTNALVYHSSNPPTRIGIFYIAGNLPFDGLIDEVAIYNQALTLSKIQKIYAQGVIRRAIAFR